MQTAFLALANYILAALLLAYNVQAFLSVRKKAKPDGKVIRAAMKIEVAAIFCLCFLVLYLRSGSTKFVYFFLIQAAAYGVITFVYKELYPRMSVLLFDNMLLLLCVGSVMLARLDFDGAVRQFVIVAAALIIALFIPAFIRAMHRLERYGYVYLGIGIAVLLAVFFFAGERLGARIWVKIFGIAMQPFEFVKVSFIFGCAAVLLRAKSWKGVFAGTVLAGIHILVMAASNDLGGALLFAVVFWVLIYGASGKKRWIFGGLSAAGAACAVAYRFFSHVQVRVLAWKDPFAVVDNEGYQLAQSLFAIGNGGFFGTGLLKGAPEQIPVVTTDYIFSAVCEELGAFFALGLLGIYLNCMLLLIRMAAKFSEDYYRLVFTGFAALFTTQVLLNVGGVTRMLPSTGVPLPFVSAGGSSAASMVLMFMLIQGMQERSGQQEKTRVYKDGFVPAVLPERAKHAIKQCSVGFLVILFSVAVYFTVFSCTQARTVIFNSYNRRQTKLEEQNARGTIFDSAGNPLAFTMLLDGKELRKYPYENLYSHVVGQVQNGSSGLEAVKEIDLLSSSASEMTKLLYRMRDAQIPGNNLFTTLRTDLQKQLHNVMNGRNGAACVIDLKEGGLLAAVSLPDFEPEYAADYVGAEDAPLFNRAFYGKYPVHEATGIFRAASQAYESGIPTPFGESVILEGDEEGITPFGAALFAGACASGGLYITPHVTEKLTDSAGKVIYRTTAEQCRLLEEEHAESYLRAFRVKETQSGVAYRYAETRVPSGSLGGYHRLAMILIPAQQPVAAVSIFLEQCNRAEEDVLTEMAKEIAEYLAKQ
ncbi:MAG: FtsW/RodA/SpoVE family cell cycle protein [Lachnospiraceae bacterium]|nr:FtsW/RodA/SpoVE family cell cycle protein [Lachnospiraceae bacterium]